QDKLIKSIKEDEWSIKDILNSLSTLIRLDEDNLIFVSVNFKELLLEKLKAQLQNDSRDPYDKTEHVDDLLYTHHEILNKSDLGQKIEEIKTEINREHWYHESVKLVNAIFNGDSKAASQIGSRDSNFNLFGTLCEEWVLDNYLLIERSKAYLLS